MAPPTAYWKKNGRPCLLSRRLTRSIVMALSALTRQASKLAPRVPAVAKASAPQARVAIQRLYGCGAVTDRVEFVACIRRGHLARPDATDEPIDGRQSTEVHRPGPHDVQRAGGRHGRTAVGGDVNRRVDDVDLAALEAVGAGDGAHLLHRGGRRHPGRHQDRADRPGKVQDFAHPCAVLGVEHAVRGDPRQAARRRIGFPHHAVQHLPLTRPPTLARMATGRLHHSVLLLRDA